MDRLSIALGQSGELAAQFDDDFLGGFQPQTLDVFEHPTIRLYM